MDKLIGKLKHEGIVTESAVELSKCSTFGIGGRATAGAYPASGEELAFSVASAIECGIDYYIVGNGSNLLFDDGGFDGLIIFTGKINGKTFDGESNTVVAGCGAGLTSLAYSAGKLSYTGLEFAYGIPGSVGGAICMNAGAFGSEISEIVLCSRVYDSESGEIIVLPADGHRFSYRHSIFCDNPGYIVLSTTLKLSEGIPDEISAKMNAYSEKRKSTQPTGERSAGSVFKRADGFITAKCIDECGLKGLSVGGAEVSRKHAGFIVNKGGATAENVLELIRIIKENLYEKYGFTPECEIKYVKRKRN